MWNDPKLKIKWPTKSLYCQKRTNKIKILIFILTKMNNALIYCLCLHDNLYNSVKNLGYVPVGLGSKNFSDGWIRDQMEIIFHIKILIMENIHFIIGYGKTT